LADQDRHCLVCEKTKFPNEKKNVMANSERRESDSASRGSQISQSKQKNLVIHNCLINRMARLEDSLQMLLDSYIEAPYTFSDEGYLPIHLACIYYPTNANVVDIIIRANPSCVIEPSKSPVVRSDTDNTITSKKTKTLKYHQMYPLHIAVINGASLEVVRLLNFQNEKVLTMKYKEGNTPLTVAIKYNAKTEIINFMLAENEMLPTLLDKRANTPLHIACMYGRCEDVIETLMLSFPEGLHVKNFEGLTPLDLALRSSDCSDDIIDLLQEAIYGAQEKISIIGM